MTTHTAVALRHLAFEDLGTLEPLLRDWGWRIQYRDIGVDTVEDLFDSPPDLLVVLGGPIGAFDDHLYPYLKTELALISERLRQRQPLLGVCLGAQLLARALGGRVGAMPEKEIGFAPLQLTSAGRASPLTALEDIPVLHWHGDRIQLPATVPSLATTAPCPTQAFAVGRHALGLQFHIEADPARLERWLIGHTLELSGAGIDLEQLRRDAAEHGGALTRAARRLMTQWRDQWEQQP
ncbi:glutamine amidotransferase [Alcanivorax xiamenensis]|uniref:Glutamine amidotransferase n=1 Tax=Alcanivorax xiamenensis TaxID=1177156 RepID=A0ABQ6Y2K5_9GAMM|nr:MULTISPECIES: glutamine amidotransferase [Alcanivorax]KAF0802360.1 glutamine amidotransferase [Alcanivorax xiamenensis]